jgi:hypothetical protein
MADEPNKISKIKKRRLPKGRRTYIRRMKQTAKKDGSIYRSPYVHRTPAKTSGE